MKKRVIVRLVLILCIAGALFAGWKAYNKIIAYRAEESASAQLRQYVNLNVTVPTDASTSTEASTATDPSEAAEPGETVPEKEPVIYPSVDFASLQSINEDVIAWIYIEGTNINYPIVQGDDNRYYTAVMADGCFNRAGSIFMDYRNQSDFSDRNTVIYGHNMNNGSMFNNLKKYTNSTFLKEHTTGKIMTPNGNFEFEIIGGYVASLADSAWQLEFANDQDFLLWLQNSMARSTIGSTVEISPEDRIITLSTCSYESSNARFVLICRIIS